MAKPVDSSSIHSAGRVLPNSGLIEPGFWEHFNTRNVGMASSSIVEPLNIYWSGFFLLWSRVDFVHTVLTWLFRFCTYVVSVEDSCMSTGVRILKVSFVL